MTDTEIPVSLNVLRRQQYLLTSDESDFFDWLLIKHRGFGFKEFNYSYAQIEQETGIKRTRLMTIINKFEKMGFLIVEVKGVKLIRALKTHFDIDYRVLLSQLPQLISKNNSEYYESWKAFLTKCSKGEKRTEKKPKNWKKEALEVHEGLVQRWNQRIDYYNEDRTDGRANSHTMLPKSPKILEKLYAAFKEFGLKGIDNAFTAFVDAVISDKKEVTRPLQCFLKNDNGYFEIINEYLDKFNTDYSYKK